MTFYEHMYDHVCTCYQTSLHCTAHHHCTARLVFFFIFLLETSTVNKETPFQSFHSLVEFSTNRSRHPWPLGQTRPLLTRCSQVHKLWTTPGRCGAAEPRSQRSTQRPGDLATWRPGLRRGGLHHLRMNLDQLDQLPRNCQRCFFFLFQKSSV